MAQMSEFLVILPDGPGAAEGRKIYTDQHEDTIKKNLDLWLGGGPIIAGREVGAPLQIKGTWALVHASTQEDALNRLKDDPFTVGKVWDWSKAQVFTVISGLRVPLENSRFQNNA